MQDYGKLEKLLKEKKYYSLNDLSKQLGKNEYKVRQDLLNYLNQEVEKLSIESNQKKCQFLKHIKETFYLKNVTIICSRIEEYGIKNREIFDIVTCRAVTSIPIIIELATSIVKVGGVLAPLKSNCLDELNDASLYKEFHLKLVDVYKYNLPIQNSKRTIPVFKKNDVTDKKYPRNYSSIVKKYKK